MSQVYVALDYGRRRIGIAVSTPLGTVHPRPCLERTALQDDLARLREIFDDTGAAAVVVGLPHNMDGTESGMEREVREFARKLAEACGLPVHGTDERLTSEAAETILANRNLGWRERKARRDSAAACLVLQDFLNAGEEAERIA